MLVLTVLAALLMAGRLTQVQGLSAERLAALAESQTVRRVVLPAERGAIVDRSGSELTLSVPQTTVWADPRLVTDPLGEATALSPILGVDVEVLRDRMVRNGSFVYLARQVTDEVADQVKALKLDGIFFIDEPRRFLTAGDLARPVLGDVGIDNDGLSGLELYFDDQLRGTPGELVFERAPGGVAIPNGRHHLQAASPGNDLVLTIDRSLQFEAERLLAERILKANARGGILVAADPRTGDILAMASLEAAWAQAGKPRPGSTEAAGERTDTELPAGIVQATKNKAVTDVFEPGSVNKVITVAAALEEGGHTPDDVLEVPDHLRVADHTFTDHDPHPTEPWSITEILIRSSNVGTIMLGQELGKQRIDAYLRRFGFGEPTGLAFPGEVGGLMLPVERWSGTTIGTVPIGQGISVTALQMLNVYNTIANGGVRLTPRLVSGEVDGRGRLHAAPVSSGTRVISEGTNQKLVDMLVEVVRRGTGTNAQVDGYHVAGKTGTARKPNDGIRGYKDGAYVASFAGFLPAEDPQLSVIVMLDEPFPIYGGLSSAPLFADFARYALRHLRIPPPPSYTGLTDADASEPITDGDDNDARVRSVSATTSTVVAPRPDPAG